MKWIFFAHHLFFALDRYAPINVPFAMLILEPRVIARKPLALHSFHSLITITSVPEALLSIHSFHSL